MPVRIVRPRAPLNINNGPGITPDPGSTPVTVASPQTPYQTFPQGAVFTRAPDAGVPAQAMGNPVHTVRAPDPTLLGFGKAAAIGRFMPPFDTNLMTQGRSAIVSAPIEQPRNNHLITRNVPFFDSNLQGFSQGFIASEREVPKTYLQGRISKFVSPPPMQIPSLPLPSVVRTENREPVRGQVFRASGKPDSGSTIPAVTQVVIAIREELKYPGWIWSRHGWVPDNLQDKYPLIAYAYPPRTVPDLVFIRSRSIGANPPPPVFADPWFPVKVARYDLPLLNLEKGSTSSRLGFSESPLIPPLLPPIVAKQAEFVLNPGGIFSQIGTEIFRNTTKLLLAYLEEPRPHSGRINQSNRFAGIETESPGFRLQVTTRQEPNPASGQAQLTIGLPDSFVTIFPGRSQVVTRIWDLVPELLKPIYNWAESGFVRTKDPPLVIDIFDIAYLVQDTFNVGDAGVQTDNQVLFVGDIRRFQIASITRDNSAWVPTSGTLYLVNPSGTVVSKTGTALSTKIYYDTISTDLNTTGSWRAYWRVSDGSVTLTYGPLEFDVRDVT